MKLHEEKPLPISSAMHIYVTVMINLPLFFCVCFRHNIPSYFAPVDERLDFICSQPDDGGMTKCNDVPALEYFGQRCNASAIPFSNNSQTNDSCINWNQYYTVCKAGVENPFHGAITFDNIGLAWVAIFQVSPKLLCCFS